MLTYLLLFLSLLTHFPLTLATPPNLTIPPPPARTIHPANSPICLDGRDLRLEVLPSIVLDDCKRMWRERLKDRTNPLKERFYQPDHKHYPLYLNGVPGGCEYRIEEPRGRRILDPPQATLSSRALNWIDDQIAMAFWLVLSQCINNHVGGILVFSTRIGSDESLKFVVHVGVQKASPPDPRQVRNVYNRPALSQE